MLRPVLDDDGKRIELLAHADGEALLGARRS
jgi:hypothetical protein